MSTTQNQQHFLPASALSFAILLLALFTGGTLSVLFGKELSWDLANYHYYAPYAFWYARSTIDYWPASFIHQYINPAIDFLPYFLINHFSPFITEFTLGAIHGINFWLLFLIARFFLSSQHTAISILLAALGMYGPTALPGIGSFQNDNLVSIFILSFVLLQLYTWKNAQPAQKYMVLSGILLGFGVGLKLTGATFAIGGLLTIMMLPISLANKIKSTLVYCLAVAIGMFLSSGYWMLILWQQHHNPFFPFLNNVFHSPDFALKNWRDLRFLPQGTLQTLFYPFYFWDGRTADVPFRDFRFLIAYVLFLLAGIQWLWEKFRYTEKLPPNLPQTWLFIFFIFSYITWQLYFANARYLVTLEMLAPLIIYLLIKHLCKNTYVSACILTVVFYSLAFFLEPAQMVRAAWYEKTFFNTQLPSFVQTTPEAMVLITYSPYALDLNPRPQTYLIPFFPPRWRFVGIPFTHEKFSADKKTTDTLSSLIQQYHQPIFLLTPAENMPALYYAAHHFGLLPNGPCGKIFSDRQRITDQEIVLCPVRML